jgi:hypothetical protein
VISSRPARGRPEFRRPTERARTRPGRQLLGRRPDEEGSRSDRPRGRGYQRCRAPARELLNLAQPNRAVVAHPLIAPQSTRSTSPPCTHEW